LLAGVHDQKVYLREANDAIVTLAMIETREAMDNLDAIAAVPGIDVLFVGPADLSHNLGVPGRFDEPSYKDALRTVVAACEKHGKAAGILAYDGAAFAGLHDQGFRFIGLGSEGSFVSAGARAMLQAAGRA
jgi:4-hydroxy-2-oxoheptanedioate aldolase